MQPVVLDFPFILLKIVKVVVIFQNHAKCEKNVNDRNAAIQRSFELAPFDGMPSCKLCKSVIGLVVFCVCTVQRPEIWSRWSGWEMLFPEIF